MKENIQDRLLRRELGNTSRYSTYRGVYGDKTWIDNLDIVNELGGHSGCVNALSWSSSGRLLASGSDDQHLNIHSYQPDSSVSPFALTTTVATGHTANIFSVKFMPHSNDRTLVTAAGDAEVRVFDIEYSGRPAESSIGPNLASNGRGQRFKNMYRGVRYLSDGNTNARVYRSHADRVKRIVTESSPNLFLTCSEDGEVRQFDLRLPSSAYPPPKGGRGFLSHHADHDSSNVPPPLISYKRFNLDLNTISCSPSQPHYIALGGAHLHCFLHDRRMLGRDIDVERGNPGRASLASSMSAAEDESMGQATRCVRKYAPEGRKQMRRMDNCHITACKISDANPNEMIVSWSGDHIYSFDLVSTPDASELNTRSPNISVSGTGKGSSRESGDRKRKRRPRSSAVPSRNRGDVALRVRYENGQSEDIAMSDVEPSMHSSTVEEARESMLNESQRRSLRIARSSVKIRKLMFSLESSSHVADESLYSSAHTASFASALELAAKCIPKMDEISRSWRYPVNPSVEEVQLQQTLRKNRNTARRFVQAAGTMARALGGKLQAASRDSDAALDLFKVLYPAPDEGPSPPRREIFCYNFLKAIFLWLEGGIQALLQGFKHPPDQRKDSQRFPIPDNAEHAAIADVLIPYLLGLAGAAAIFNVDASRFEKDETRKIFDTETAAVLAFSSALKIPLEDLSRKILPAFSGEQDRILPAAQDRRTALKYWGFKVGRGVLMNAGEGVNFQYVDMAFGGIGTGHMEEGRVQEDIDLNETEDFIETLSVVSGTAGNPMVTGVSQHGRASAIRAQNLTSDIDIEDEGSDDEVILMDDLHNDIAEHMAAEYDNSNDEDDDNENDDQDSDAEDNGDITAEESAFMFRSASGRGELREKVERNVPCSSHSRQYKGHCNVKTVKDANFFGLGDEYVVSGSDGGHLFIWDKRTSQLVNILEGDNEVVNVVQGHPYEPILAVSGIDHTIKIFSPDSKAQEDAQAGTNISSSANSSTGYSSISGRQRRNLDRDVRAEPRLPSRKRMHQSYQIISQNDVQRQGGMRDAFITVIGPFPRLRTTEISFADWRGMLAQLAARLRARQAQGGEGDAGAGGVVFSEDGEAVVLDDNCTVM